MAKKIKKNKRLLFQALWTALTNGYLYGFISGKIYTGKTKDFCVPGLNCYSCPGALGSCPIGSLQASLNSPLSKISFYVFGFLLLFGSLFGRFVCGWLCPFGMIQDLLHKIPLFKKRKNLPGHNALRWLKFLVLALFVLILPVSVTDGSGSGQPWFCEYVCPSGTLLGSIPLIITNHDLLEIIGFRFWWKIGLLLAIIIVSIKVYRPFCKYLCPLGAFYSLFNPIALYQYNLNKDLCNGCGACEKKCQMGINPAVNPNSMECIRCGECVSACAKGAISVRSLINKNEDAQTKK